ncbi:hypothetical protein RJ639_028407 [Escallonia herrerae]|uniref:Chromosome segregation in meiosis protein 3 domain-containing protein n=1 Tax=Escallonia herrerae TaxID=1293975 RepID=A0AA89BKP3_9ASTE|nr:hypothetical protein RJ639_028407 [Escallonia herrerae]
MQSCYSSKTWRSTGICPNSLFVTGILALRQIWTLLFKLLGLELHFSTSFHLQTDGQTKSVNLIFLEALVSSNQTDLAKLLDVAQFSYNVHRIEVENHNAFEIATGLQPLTPRVGRNGQTLEGGAKSTTWRHCDGDGEDVTASIQDSKEGTQVAIKEVSDLGNLLGLYAEWHSHLLPYYSFNQFVHKLEQVGGTKRVKVVRLSICIAILLVNYMVPMADRNAKVDFNYCNSYTSITHHILYRLKQLCVRDLRQRIANGVDPTKLHDPPVPHAISNNEQGAIGNGQRLLAFSKAIACGFNTVWLVAE